MRTKEIKLPLTPITEKTFKRQGWKKISSGDGFDDEAPDDSAEHYYFTLSIPKDRDDEFSTMFVSNATDELIILRDIGEVVFYVISLIKRQVTNLQVTGVFLIEK